jgi:glyoxylase-like metal-dependent hydrolase (beta-lactamase superfamily II)/8-oxo-dGTP pyrophosphatase MutT (NUDIX family)
VSELPDGIPSAEPATPRASASGVILGRDDAGEWRVLLGLRHRRSRFLPGFLACPGGRLEPGDRPGEPGAFARCAAREVEEETGVSLPADRWLEAGERTTPPIFPVRFRTFFFVAEVEEPAAIPDASPSPDEIEALRFETAGRFLHQWANGRVKVPPPTLAILRAMERAGPLPLPELARVIAEANRREEGMPRIEFTPGTWMLPLRSRTLPPASHTNAWMPGGRRFVVVDPGSDDRAEIDRLLRVVRRREAVGASIDSVVLTHHHGDHVAGAAEVSRRLGVPLRGHPTVLDRFRDEEGLILQPLDEGGRIELDGLVLVALHTPGHAAGHLALLLEGRGAIVIGDLISGLSTILIDPDEGDMEAYLESLRRVRDLGCRQLLPGHGPPLPGKALEKLIEHRRQRERLILRQLQPPHVELQRISRGAYADLPDAPAALVERQALSHLILLERRGEARRVDSGGNRWAPAE